MDRGREHNEIVSDTVGGDFLHTVKCAACGSGDMEFLSGGVMRCRYCGAKTVISKPQRPVNITNEIHLHESEANAVDRRNYTLKRSETEMSFMRKALIALAADRHTPPDILESDFAPVSVKYLQFIRISADVHIDYSVSIGYDRQEEYLEKTKKGVEKKTRIVTDWHPQTGSIDSENVDISFIPYADKYEEDKFAEFLVRKPSAVIPPEKADFDFPAPSADYSSAQSRALDKCVKTAVGQCKSKLPGDKNKDFDYTVKSKITSVYLYVVPEYVMGYKYKNTAYELGVYFSENAPSAREIPDYTPVRNKEIYDKNKALDTVSITVSVLCSILAVLLMFFDIMQILFWTALSLAVAGTALFACAENRHVKTAETVSARLQKAKSEKAAEVLRRRDFGAMTAAELELFGNKYRQWSLLRGGNGNEDKAADKLRTPRRVFFTVSCIACVLAIIVSLASCIS